MERCTSGLGKHATKEDPQAKKFCMEECPLTLRTPIYNEDGSFSHIEHNWCQGVARDSDGYYTFENVLSAMNSSDGDTFHVEHACNRPISAGPVYNPYHVQRSYRTVLPFLDDPEKRKLFKDFDSKIVGIDWGFKGETAIVGPIHFNGRTLEIPKTIFVTGAGIEDIGSMLEQLKFEYGNFGIFCDSSHPFNIDFLSIRGWDVEPVAFNKWKEYGIGNVSRWFAKRRIHIRADEPGNEKLKRQLLLYYRGKSGKPEKKEDHGPDALLCGMMNWNFLDYFVDEVGLETEEVFAKGDIKQGEITVSEKYLW